MKASDLGNAQRLLDHLASTRGMLARLESGAALTLVVGEGGAAAALHLSAKYIEGLRHDVVGSLKQRERQLVGDLAVLGVETD